LSKISSDTKNPSEWRLHTQWLSCPHNLNFLPTCKLHIHHDTGANMGSLTDKRLFYIYYDLPSQYQTAAFASSSSLPIMDSPIPYRAHASQSQQPAQHLFSSLPKSLLRIQKSHHRNSLPHWLRRPFLKKISTPPSRNTIEVEIMCVSSISTHNISQLWVRQQKVMSTHNYLCDIHIRLGHVSIDTIIEMCNAPSKT
jgi:hypothetical protein